MELWQSLLVAFGGNAALLLVLGFLGRSLISTFLAKDVEGFKANLQTTLTKDVERFRADLQQAAVEHEVRFSELHEKRAEVLAELYKLLVAAYWGVSEFTSASQSAQADRRAQYLAAHDSIATYFRFFDQHRIWLPPELCAPLEEFARQLRTPTIRLGIYISIERPTESTLRDQLDAWIKASEVVSTDVPRLREAIESEFRKLLGAHGPIR